MEGVPSKKKRLWHKDDLTDLVFSWSLENIFDENLYKDQVFLSSMLPLAVSFLLEEPTLFCLCPGVSGTV